MADSETTRLEAFSDGVFAIAITLLVLELKVPHLEGVSANSAVLWSQLADLWHDYFALVTSFFTILVMWVHHHNILRMVRRTDSRLLYANGLLLLAITVVPFPTAIVAKYLRTPAAAAACAAYSLLFVFISIAFYLLILAAFRKSLLDPQARPEVIERIRAEYRWGPPLYAISVGAAFISPWLSMGICTGLWIFWAIMTRTVCEE